MSPSAKGKSSAKGSPAPPEPAHDEEVDSDDSDELEAGGSGTPRVITRNIKVNFERHLTILNLL